MSFLVAAVILVGALCLLDLLLTLGVIRRLKDHTTHLEGLLQLNESVPGLPRVGATAGDFTATTVDGEPVSRDLLVGETLIAFFASGCGPCVTKIPGFVEYARNVAGERRQVLAVVSGESEETAEMVEALTPAARVTVEQAGGQICGAFTVSTFPSFCVVDSTGTVIAAEREFALLPVPTRA